MQPSVVRAGMARLGASLLCLGLLTAPVAAGDRALLDLIGYSADAGFFAFEEFGIQDGSGFAYSSLYIVDLSEDEWVVGTPVRVQASTEETSLSQVRQEVRAKAAEQLAALGIDRPAELVAQIGDGAAGMDGTSLRFGLPGFAPGTVREEHELRLSTFPVTAAAPCKQWFAVDPLGYQLVLADEGGTRQIHRDDTLPRSRGCPATYRLYGVALPFEAQSLADAVALVSVYPGGFEGPDRRFIAVPLDQ
jgi:predicted secreted protein